MIDLCLRIANLSQVKRALLAQHLDEQITPAAGAAEADEAKSLCGFVVAKPGAQLSNVELREFLGKKVPRYMVPSALVILEKLPLTPNGKIDRRALSHMELASDGVRQNGKRPSSPIEDVLLEIWSDVLQLDLLGVDDDFFERGGHSLLATRVVSRVRETFQVDLPLQALFDSPTIAEFATCIERTMNALAAAPVFPLERVSRDGELPLSFAQHGLWVRAQIEPDTPLYNISSSLRLKGQLDAPALSQVLTEIVRRHETLRTVFPTIDGQPRQHTLPAAAVSIPVISLRHLSPAEREGEALRSATEEARRSFDLGKGPLLRVNLLQLDDEDHVLLCTMHHIISDGWSISILIQEVMAYYQMFVTGTFSPLPELSIQYADYAHWQRRWLDGEVLERQLSYWRQQLKGVRPKLDLPGARPRPALQTFDGVTQPWMLDIALTKQLKSLGRREGSTLFMTLLAAFQTLLYRYSGQDDIVIGSPIANRNRRGVEGLIGYFVNVLALRTDLSGNPTFRELLGRVRSVALSAYAHQDVPFERVLNELRLKRDPRRSPLYQAVLVLQNAPALDLKLPDLTVSPLASDRGTTHVDLYFSVAETEQGLAGLLKYNTDLFDSEMITHLLNHFYALLAEVVADPDVRLLDIPLLEHGKSDDISAAAGVRHFHTDDQFVF